MIGMKNLQRLLRWQEGVEGHIVLRRPRREPEARWGNRSWTVRRNLGERRDETRGGDCKVKLIKKWNIKRNWLSIYC